MWVDASRGVRRGGLGEREKIESDQSVIATVGPLFINQKLPKEGPMGLGALVMFYPSKEPL